MVKHGRFWWICGTAVGVLLALVILAAPSGSVAEEHEPAGNHFKCYQVLDWAEWEPRRVELRDQFGASIAAVIEPRLLCNPVDKNGEGIPDKKSHLVCYEINDDPQGRTPRVKEVMIRNQFQQGPLWVGSAGLLCVPSDKSYESRG